MIEKVVAMVSSQGGEASLMVDRAAAARFQKIETPEGPDWEEIALRKPSNREKAAQAKLVQIVDSLSSLPAYGTLHPPSAKAVLLHKLAERRCIQESISIAKRNGGTAVLNVGQMDPRSSIRLRGDLSAECKSVLKALEMDSDFVVQYFEVER